MGVAGEVTEIVVAHRWDDGIRSWMQCGIKTCGGIMAGAG